jgi:ribonuclease HIII
MNQKSESSSTNIFVTTIHTSLAPRLLQDLKEQGFEITMPPYSFFQAKKKGVSCSFYHSGKLTVQGKEMGPFIEFYLEPSILKTFPFTHKNHDEEGSELDLTPRIGIDESGKGDFFGPLCIAGVYGDAETIPQLKKIGVRDSKTLSEAAILTLAKKIQNSCPHQIVKINPLKYNELIVQFGNLNKLLAWGHATTIEQLAEKTTCKKIIIDQFANEHVVLTALKRKKLQLDLLQRHRGEEDLVVAAASILARSAFVEGMYMLEKQYNMKLPKGASKQTIEAGRKFVNAYGRESLRQVGKLHFKTLDSILD